MTVAWIARLGFAVRSQIIDIGTSARLLVRLLLLLGAAFRRPALLRDQIHFLGNHSCLLYTSPSPRDKRQSRMPSSA